MSAKCEKEDIHEICPKKKKKDRLSVASPKSDQCFDQAIAVAFYLRFLLRRARLGREDGRFLLDPSSSPAPLTRQ